MCEISRAEMRNRDRVRRVVMSRALTDEKGAGIKGGYQGSMLDARCWRHWVTFLVRSGRAFPRRKVFAPAGLLVSKVVG